MQIGLTKKLQDQTGIKVEAAAEENEIFSWSANLITVNRRKTVVVVNNMNRYGFILYGLKAKEFKNIEKLILEGIRHCLKDLRIDDAIIEKYLNDAETISFTKTKGPKVVSPLNAACTCATCLESIYDNDNIYQKNVSRKMNQDIIKMRGTNDYIRPLALMIIDLQNFYQHNIIKCRAVQLSVKLDLNIYSAERNIITPTNIDFEELHRIIQIAYGWADYHLHDFLICDSKGKGISKVISDDEDDAGIYSDMEIVNEKNIILSDYINKEYSIIYEYDFGDGWDHQVIIGDIIEDYDKYYPVCVSAVHDTPPEDVGGIPGYIEFLKVIENPNHPEYQHMKEWAESQHYYKSDIETINCRLNQEFR